jgi:hypothetical protein
MGDDNGAEKPPRSRVQKPPRLRAQKPPRLRGGFPRARGAGAYAQGKQLPTNNLRIFQIFFKL